MPVTVTRDPKFPAEAAQLMEAFNRCADAHSVQTVREATAQMMIAVICGSAKAAQIDDHEIEEYADMVLRGVRRGVILNWNREAQPTDIPVKAQ